MRVLVVDDNRDAVFILSKLLEIAGHESRCASSGEEAFRVAVEFQPEAALLDVGLPNMDGYAAAKNIRSIPGLAGIRIVLQSGYSPNNTKNLDFGIDCHLTKPVDINAVLTAIGAKPLMRSRIS